MKRLLIPLLLLFVGLAPSQIQAQAPNHIINVAGFAFIDSVSGTTNTTVNCGDTIEWVLLDTIAHLCADGTGPSDPNQGARFTFSLDTFTPSTSFTWTATEPGTFDYFCFPHFGFGMVGTITVLPPANLLTGSGEDFKLDVASGGVSVCDGLTSVTAGSILDCEMISPNGFFDGLSPILVAELFPTGMTGPGSPAGFPYIHVTLNAIVIFNGQEAPPFGGIVLTPNGLTLSGLVPPTLVGSTLRLQSLVPTAIAADGIFAFSDAVDIEIL